MKLHASGERVHTLVLDLSSSGSLRRSTFHQAYVGSMSRAPSSMTNVGRFGKYTEIEIVLRGNSDGMKELGSLFVGGADLGASTVTFQLRRDSLGRALHPLGLMGLTAQCALGTASRGLAAQYGDQAARSLTIRIPTPFDKEDPRMVHVGTSSAPDKNSHVGWHPMKAAKSVILELYPTEPLASDLTDDGFATELGKMLRTLDGRTLIIRVPETLCPPPDPGSQPFKLKQRLSRDRWEQSHWQAMSSLTRRTRGRGQQSILVFSSSLADVTQGAALEDSDWDGRRRPAGVALPSYLGVVHSSTIGDGQHTEPVAERRECLDPKGA